MFTSMLLRINPPMSTWPYRTSPIRSECDRVALTTRLDLSRIGIYDVNVVIVNVYNMHILDVLFDKSNSSELLTHTGPKFRLSLGCSNGNNFNDFIAQYIRACTTLKTFKSFIRCHVCHLENIIKSWRMRWEHYSILNNFYAQQIICLILHLWTKLLFVV